MALNFNELRAKRNTAFDTLNTELNKLSAKTFQNDSNDDRFWQPSVDKAGNGYAVVRFLAPAAGEDTNFVRRWDHGFKGEGGWYIELSRTTLGEEDPVTELNSKLWNQGEGSFGRKIVSGHGKEQPGSKRRLHYIANILVVNDQAKPENNGKVKLFKFGAKIFDKLNDAMVPKFEDEKPLNPFNMWGIDKEDASVPPGADFRIKIRNVEGYRNYDKSDFADPAPMFDDDAKIEAAWNQAASLDAFMDAKLFKPYDVLKAKLLKVLGPTITQSVGETAVREDVAAKTTAPKAQASTSAPKQEAASTVDDSQDDSLEFFKSLAK